MAQIKIRRGTAAELSGVTLELGELGYTTDGKEVFIGNGISNTLVGPISGSGGGLEWSFTDIDLTAVANNGYMVDVSGGFRTITLPLNPVEGDTVGVMDGTGNVSAIDYIFVNRNGQPIMGVADDLLINDPNQSLILTYSNATDGWRLTTLTPIASDGFPAEDITTNTVNFDNNLSSADDTVQKALDTIDNLSISGGGGGIDDVDAGTGITIDKADPAIPIISVTTGAYEPFNANIQTHIGTVTGNPHVVTATEVGLGNVDDTSDANKPVSTATQTALDLKSDDTHDHDLDYEPINTNIQTHISTITGNPHAVTVAEVGGEPANANIQTHIGTVTGNPHAVTATEVGLGNVDDTSDANKPVSTATQTALDLKEDDLDNPTVDGHILSSLTDGTRSWVEDQDTIYDDTAIQDNLNVLNKLNSTNGFVERTDSTLSFVDGTRTLSIAPVGANFVFWAGGVEFTKTTEQSVVIPDIEGYHYVYFDTSGVLSSITVFDVDELIFNSAYVVIIAWNSTLGMSIVVGDERHGLMDSNTHYYLHESFHAQWVSGLNLANMIVDGDGSLDAHAQVAVANGVFRDEDIRFEISSGSPQTLTPIAQIPMFYRDGVDGHWVKTPATDFPCTKATDRLYWNENTSGTIWQRTEVTSNKDFTLTHIFGTGDIDEPIVGIMGQNQYPTRGQAEIGAEDELTNILFGTLETLLPEMVTLATIIFETDTAKTNSVAASIESTISGDDYVDWRFSSSSIGGSGGGVAGLEDVDAGTGITIDKANPSIPVISVTTGAYEPFNTNIQTHIANVTTNPHDVDQTDVGLGNVDNTADANKNVDQVDGYHADEAKTGSTLVARDSLGHIYANSVSSNYHTDPVTTWNYFMVQESINGADTRMLPVTVAQVNAYLGGSGSGLDADKLDGYNSDVTDTGLTIVLRDSDGDVRGRQFNSSTTTKTPFTIASTVLVANLNAEFATKFTTARTINGVSFDGTANIIVEPYISNDDTGDTNCPIVFTANSTAGYKRLYEDSGLYYNNTNNVLITSRFQSVEPNGTAPFLVASATRVVNLNSTLVNGYTSDQLRGLEVGSNTQDPNIAVDPYILTSHANMPGSGVFFHVRTQFYQTLTSTAKRSQIAITYSINPAQVWARSYYTSWTAWVQL